MRINKDTTIFAAIRSHPRAADILKSYDMSCSGCLNIMDSIANGARRHGVDLEKLLAELNTILDRRDINDQ